MTDLLAVKNVFFEKQAPVGGICLREKQSGSIMFATRFSFARKNLLGL